MIDEGEWRVEASGDLRTPAGMKAARLTRLGEIEFWDRVEHRPVALGLAQLLALWLAWRAND